MLTRARRGEIRLPLSLPGNLIPAGAPPLSAQVLDLSRGGARCRVSPPPPIGSEADLKLEGLSVPGTICWRDGDLCGLRFIRPLRAGDVLQQLDRSRAAAEPERRESARFFLAAARPLRQMS